VSGTAAIVLAAGLSSRLAPEFKPLADLGGASLLERCVQVFRDAGVADLLCVCGHRAGEVRDEAALLGLPCVENPEYARGMFTSVRAGLSALPPGIDAVFMLPVDIPLVRPATLRALRARFAEAPVAVLHPVFEGQRGHPPLVPAEFIPAILAWKGPGGLAGALEQFPSLDVPVADRSIHFDVDAPEDLAEARRRWSRRGIPTRTEALALLRLHNAGERGLGHALGVAAAALGMARALNARGAALDLELVESAALLHDISKGQKRHEQAGAALLEALDFRPVARIVEAHRDIAPADAPEITERELVYLADKLVWGSQRVSVEARFQQKLDAFAHDQEACAAIRRRLANALDMQGRVEAAAASLEVVLTRKGT
jgi:putative nucleotidyltransferase with HDIG domain